MRNFVSFDIKKNNSTTQTQAQMSTEVAMKEICNFYANVINKNGHNF
jgi:hypothetical protein